jgi:16S rRNA (cytosine967-C5)-methyltransferase
MNKLPFREHHLIQLLDNYSAQQLPLDLFMNRYFRDHSALGSKDRAFIAETSYALIRWKSLLDHLTKSSNWEERFKHFNETDITALQKNESIPLYIRASCPEHLLNLLMNQYGKEKAHALCLVNNTPAPTTIRANLLKTTRDALFDRLKNTYDVSTTAHSSQGITFHKKIQFFQTPEFKEGLFEVQDEGSQLLADLVQVKPGEQVLDYCAGSGGKTLAFAPKMEGKGQIHLHDTRITALQEARKRCKRAGIQNYQLLPSGSPQEKKLKKKMDWVLVDAPCSGTGTLRRNPDMKWKLTPEMIKNLVSEQRIIFEKALSFMHPNGRIVYATCSLLQQENQKQLEHFISTYSLAVEGEIFQTLPTYGGMDGFFGVVLKKA